MIIKKDYIIYRNLTKVVDLILKNEKIESIEPSALNGLYQIKSIILEFNFIKLFIRKFFVLFSIIFFGRSIE